MPAEIESDFWNLDGPEPDLPVPTPPTPITTTRQDADRDKTDARKWTTGALDKHRSRKKKSRKKSDIRINVPLNKANSRDNQHRHIAHEFADLEDFTDASSPPIEDATDPTQEETPDATHHPDTPQPSELPAETTEEPSPDSAPPQIELPTATSSQTGGTPPQVSADAATKPPFSLKSIELAGLALLALLLVAIAMGGYFWSIHQLPEKKPQWSKIPFPVRGEIISIADATTYWRKPVLEGPDRDPIRRGTVLIPVAELEITGGPAAVRAIFRNDEGRAVGDPIIRSIPSNGKLTVTATAGFEDLGAHAAYRANELEPWILEISEAPSVNSPGSSFSRVLNIHLSPELR